MRWHFLLKKAKTPEIRPPSINSLISISFNHIRFFVQCREDTQLGTTTFLNDHHCARH